MPGIVTDLPDFCGAEEKVREVTSSRQPVFLNETNLHLDRLQATCAVALHMHQPLIPAGGSDLQTADVISNLDAMMHGGSDGDSYNAHIFAECYARMSDIIPELVQQGKSPRMMLDYSGQLLYGLIKMGREDILDRLRGITCDPHMRRYAEWLGTMWGHAVVSSTPPPDYLLHIRAWQQNFASIFGWDALERVKGFSPPEMHLPNHPDVAYEYVKVLKECGFRWLLVQEHTVETLAGSGLQEKHLPHRLVAKNSQGEEVSIVAIIKTQGSDTKLVAQMQPLYEAKGLSRQEVSGISIPPIVTQIADGENGGVMMNEFPDGYRNAVHQVGAEGVVLVNATEYLELIQQAGVNEDLFPVCRPIHQGKVFAHISNWEPGAADKAIEAVQKDHPGFNIDGGSWTNDISWVKGYENLLNPMNKLSAAFHEKIDNQPIDKNGYAYRNALFHLLTAETSCFRYWGQGTWTDYGRELCRRGMEILQHDF